MLTAVGFGRNSPDDGSRPRRAVVSADPQGGVGLSGPGRALNEGSVGEA